MIFEQQQQISKQKQILFLSIIYTKESYSQLAYDKLLLEKVALKKVAFDVVPITRLLFAFKSLTIATFAFVIPKSASAIGLFQHPRDFPPPIPSPFLRAYSSCELHLAYTHIFDKSQICILYCS